MKILKGISGLIGFFIPAMIGGTLDIPEGMLLVWICIFSFGILGKLLLQAFDKPFLNSTPNIEVRDRHTKILNLLSTFLLFVGLGSQLGEIVFFQKIGVLPITLIIFAISIYFSAHYIHPKKWFFDQ
jgi:hypothetical protein